MPSRPQCPLSTTQLGGDRVCPLTGGPIERSNDGLQQDTHPLCHTTTRPQGQALVTMLEGCSQATSAIQDDSRRRVIDSHVTTRGVCRVEPKDVLSALVKNSGKSMRTISMAIGRSPNFLASTTQKRSTPHCETVANVADVCGYDLLLRKRSDGSEIIIDPPSKDD